LSKQIKTELDVENPFIVEEPQRVTVKKVFNAGDNYKAKYHGISKENPFVVATFLWNDPRAKHVNNYQFTAAHVNRLAKAFRDHLLIPHEFVVVTDMPEGIDTRFIRIVPMWDDLRYLGRCFARLKTFDSSMKEVFGERFCVIDLDVVIPEKVWNKDENLWDWNNLASIFDRPEPLVGYRDSKNPNRNPANKDAPKLPTYSGALRVQTAGEGQAVWRVARAVEQWKFNRPGFTADFVGSDQCVQSMILEGRYPRLSTDDGIYDYWAVEALGDQLPDNCKILMMNGMTRDASMPNFYEKHSWLKQWWQGAYTWNGTKEITAFME
jgi:hypothetical protein